MSTDFMKWLEEHKDEYSIKIIENPTEEQKAQFEKDCQSILDWIRAMKELEVSNE